MLFAFLLEEVQLEINQLEVALVLSPALHTKVHIDPILVVVIVVAASPYIKLVSRAAVLQCVEHVQTVVLIELERRPNFLCIGIITVVAVTSLLVIILFRGGVFEEVELQFFVLQDAVLKCFFFVYGLQVAVKRQIVVRLALEGDDTRGEARMGLALELL